MPPANWCYDNDLERWVCDDCEWTFDEKSDVLEHLEDDHWYCRPCDYIYNSEESRRQHWANASKHAGDYCSFCESLVSPGDTMEEHDEAMHWPCRGCEQVFDSSEACARHGQDSHPWCSVHKRAFLSQANYEAHLRSAAHVGRTQPCPFRCGGTFTDRSAVAQHLEGGACSSGVTRAKIDKFLRSYDQSRFITTGRPQNLIGGPEPVTKYIATEKSWNASRNAYVCVLCNGSFGTLRGLNAHLASPRHTYAGVNGSGEGEKPYKCPNTACGKKFSTLSGVVQHAESGSCGVLQVRGMTSALDGVLGGMRRLTL
ncbi:hypothetical protein JCM10908_001557 [Rhodotorula pacifica]|uniref:uncharacterized protein n=1 Tax=Rhodotorula pacifica TaxID=1495444 RepID=UPI0031765C2D